ncbi:PREDICTED: ralBP1-associated Eps domain-containing protein 1 [Diuraphis noxia]|uniref:ralBP1-associated Eps domain-containing protein 1 n=1 Tax=Diuraphis noxia TaxID=143948 RepID=UPI0007635523|nr:PREDICTED: ralBP1-associated Eps domain-containing protein 1 [Diuraphis noxia]
MTDSQMVIVNTERDVERTQNSSATEASSTASDSPTPTNSVQDKNWVHWHGPTWGDEQRQLLGTEEEADSSDCETVSTANGIGIWSMNEEQSKYYEEQFASMQPNPKSLLAGSIARSFFEKSRLPLHELKEIWQLSDVTKDGALSLAEFKLAMHLVVLRRNNITLPKKLPPSLVPPAVSPVQINTTNNTIVSPTCSIKSKEWTKFIDSPTSSLSSPGPKPVNFDFQKSSVEQDPKILHPVAVRVTPGIDNCLEDQEKETLSNNVEEMVLIKSIQRPQAKKLSSHVGPGALPPPPLPTYYGEDMNSGPASLPVVIAKKEPPPPPPPRPYRAHMRSSSLDLNKLGKFGAVNSTQGPPVVPPRITPSPNSNIEINGLRQNCERTESGQFADFAQCPGAFQVYKKPLSETQSNENSSTTGSEIHGVQALESSSSIKLEERNAHLRLVYQELQKQLNDLREERAGLQLLLDTVHKSSPPSI